jgi:hypothetical protein
MMGGGTKGRMNVCIGTGERSARGVVACATLVIVVISCGWIVTCPPPFTSDVGRCIVAFAALTDGLVGAAWWWTTDAFDVWGVGCFPACT